MKLIPLDAVLAEIDKRIKTCLNQREEMIIADCEALVGDATARAGELQCLRDSIESLEVKEVDLEDSVKESLAQKYIDYTFKRHNIDPESKEGQLIYYAYMHGMNQCLDQLRTKKGE